MTAHVGESAEKLTNAQPHMRTDTQALCIFTVTDDHAVFMRCTAMHVHTCIAWKCMEIKDVILHCISIGCLNCGSS